MTRHSAEGAIASILWRIWEEALPNTPYQMALVIAAQLRREGYLRSDDDPSRVEGREALSPHLSRCELPHLPALLE